MTREEWNTCTDPRKMWAELAQTTDSVLGVILVTERKLELWCCACCWSHGLVPRERCGSISDMPISMWAGYWMRLGLHADPTSVIKLKNPDIRCDLLRQMLGDVFAPVKIEKKYITTQVLQLAQQAYENVNNGQLDQLTLMALADALIEAGCPVTKCKFCGGEGRPMELVRVPIPNSTRLGLPRQSGNRVDCPMCKGSGVRSHPILSSLRSSEPKYRGLWSLDLILGFE